MRDRDTIIVKDDNNSSASMLLGIVAIGLLVLAVWFFAVGPGAGTAPNTDTNPGAGGNTPTPQQATQAPEAT